ncbi:MAG TPA: PKD domain-containing protein [Gemmatimonadales bacterium]|nr:PKD domain-containing protein [Gemmatimonadales bacterium]
MRSLRLLAATTVILLGVAGCGGDDDGGIGPGTRPNANFTPPACTANVPCTFADASTDNGTITTWSWTFGDPANGTSNLQNPTYTYGAAGTYTVTLTVTDNEGNTDDHSAPVTVTGGTTNQPPVADFELTSTTCTQGTPCGFHSLSTDPDGTIQAAAWDFGDNTAPGQGVDVTHTYENAGTYSVTLTVTDNLGATGTVTEQITVAQAQSQDCTTTGTVVDCILTVGIRSTVKFTIVSEACDFTGNRLEITTPREQIVFFNLCNQLPGNEYTVLTNTGAPWVFEPGTQLGIHFVRGTPGPTDPPASDPGIQVDGSSPSWTLNIDDGGNAGAPGEPDFNDAVVSVTASPAP